MTKSKSETPARALSRTEQRRNAYRNAFAAVFVDVNTKLAGDTRETLDSAAFALVDELASFVDDTRREHLHASDRLMRSAELAADSARRGDSYETARDLVESVGKLAALEGRKLLALESFRSAVRFCGTDRGVELLARVETDAVATLSAGLS